MDTLVLFDIDDTLLVTKGGSAEKRGAKWNETFNQILGVDTTMTLKEDMIGKTESEIFMEAARRGGISPEEARKKLPEAFRMIAQRSSGDEFQLLPGVYGLLAELKMRGIPFGLLTGNSRERSQIKLSKVGLAGEFLFGAFGDEAERRVDLFLVALKKAKEELGKGFEPENIWIVGDSPGDVRVGKHWGARTIAVATGPYSEEELKAAGAEVVLKDLSERKKIIDIIKGG